MENKELVQQVNKDLATQLPDNIGLEELKSKLALHINYLIQNDFEQLVNLLYRIDVSEAKIKSLLQHNPNENAGDIIAVAVIERQLQKIKTRELFGKRDNDFNEEEKW